MTTPTTDALRQMALLSEDELQRRIRASENALADLRNSVPSAAFEAARSSGVAQAPVRDALLAAGFDPVLIAEAEAEAEAEGREPRQVEFEVTVTLRGTATVTTEVSHPEGDVNESWLESSIFVDTTRIEEAFENSDGDLEDVSMAFDSWSVDSYELLDQD